MKLIAWNDQYPGRPKDAEDLLFLMVNYAEAGNLDRLYGPESELLQGEDFDQTLAGIRLLGRDMGAMAAAVTGQAVQAILGAETGEQQRYRLVIDMVKTARIRDRSDEVLANLGKLAEGFSEGQGH